MDCLFCKIINKEIPSSIIYEDSDVLAFLDINPTTNGDTLIISKKHYKHFLEVPNEILVKMYEVAQKLYPMYKEKLHCDGITISHNTDYGQEIKHFHIHFIPRYKDDGVRHLANKEMLKNIEEIHEILKD